LIMKDASVKAAALLIPIVGISYYLGGYDSVRHAGEAGLIPALETFDMLKDTCPTYHAQNQTLWPMPTNTTFFGNFSTYFF